MAKNNQKRQRRIMNGRLNKTVESPHRPLSSAQPVLSKAAQKPVKLDYHYPYSGSASATPSKTNIFSLPAEIRNIIYELVIGPSCTLRIDSSNSAQPSLARVCKQLRCELFPLWKRTALDRVELVCAKVLDCHFNAVKNLIQALPARKIDLHIIFDFPDSRKGFAIGNEARLKAWLDWIKTRKGRLNIYYTNTRRASDSLSMPTLAKNVAPIHHTWSKRRLNRRN